MQKLSRSLLAAKHLVDHEVKRMTGDEEND